MIIWQCAKTDLEPIFCNDIETLLQNSEFYWYVTSGRRSITEQTRLYSKYLSGGPKAAPPGKSAHNYGLAVDVVPDGDIVKPGLQMMWEVTKHIIGMESKMAPWLWLRDAIKNHPRLHSGSTFNDWPHIEKYKWQEFINWNKAK